MSPCRRCGEDGQDSAVLTPCGPVIARKPPLTGASGYSCGVCWLTTPGSYVPERTASQFLAGKPGISRPEAVGATPPALDHNAGIGPHTVASTGI